MRGSAWVGLGIALAALAALAACEAGPDSNELGLCSTMCRCLADLPGQQQECVAECVAEGDIVDLSGACEACVLANGSSCVDLLTKCEDPCTQPRPVPDMPGDL